MIKGLSNSVAVPKPSRRNPFKAGVLEPIQS